MNTKIVRHFKTQDPTLSSWITRVNSIPELRPADPDTYFFKLCREIAYQQLADKAATAIFSRFEELLSQKKITPARVLKIPHQKLRSVGLSNSKAKYVRNLAEAVVRGELRLKALKDMEDEEVVEALTKVKGIGPWTAEMFLMFTLGREDVFSFDDLGLRNAMKVVYKFKKDPSKEWVERIVNKWSPYKTYGCLVLWGVVDSK